ncbi:MAG: hypothetical protein M1823_000643 [Watsoniomyces obsoletus]|nr:MAG: hypothetical protein M1823_000643 [Watsoniomyces obsoletus]
MDHQDEEMGQYNRAHNQDAKSGSKPGFEDEEKDVNKVMGEITYHLHDPMLQREIGITSNEENMRRTTTTTTAEEEEDMATTFGFGIGRGGLRFT